MVIICSPKTNAFFFKTLVFEVKIYQAKQTYTFHSFREKIKDKSKGKRRKEEKT
jgi:hypothetical protein